MSGYQSGFPADLCRPYEVIQWGGGLIVRLRCPGAIRRCSTDELFESLARVATPRASGWRKSGEMLVGIFTVGVRGDDGVRRFQEVVSAAFSRRSAVTLLDI